jgi:hypothetical protein
MAFAIMTWRLGKRLILTNCRAGQISLWIAFGHYLLVFVVSPVSGKAA